MKAVISRISLKCLEQFLKENSDLPEDTELIRILPEDSSEASSLTFSVLLRSEQFEDVPGGRFPERWIEKTVTR